MPRKPAKNDPAAQFAGPGRGHDRATNDPCVRRRRIASLRKSIAPTIRLAFIARNDYVAPTDISRMTLAPLTSLLMIAWMKTAY